MRSQALALDGPVSPNSSSRILPLAVIADVADRPDSDMDARTPCEDFTVSGLWGPLFGSIAPFGKALGVAVPAQPTAPPDANNLNLELLVHAWDSAKATGEEVTVSGVLSPRPAPR